MAYSLREIEIENFKSYDAAQQIKLSDLSVFLGANSSGKSTALQAMLVIKQTMECNSPDIDLLLSGKYVALGEFDDVISDNSKKEFSFSFSFTGEGVNESNDDSSIYKISWTFVNSDERTHAKLNRIEVEFGEDKVRFVCVSSELFQVFVNEKETPIHIEIRNLRLTKALISYDTEFNKLFVAFMNELYECIDKKKAKKVSNQEMVSESEVPGFYLRLFRENRIPSLEENKESKDVITIADNVVELINKYCYHQYPAVTDYLGLPNDLKKGLFRAIIRQCENQRDFETITKKYADAYERYVNGVGRDKKISEYEEKREIGLTRTRYFGDEKESGTEIDLISFVCDFYDGFEENVISRIFFVGPIRENPKGLYNIGFENVPKYVGPTGSNFASVLLHENKIKDYILPNNEVDKISLQDALDEWAAHLNIASSISVAHSNSFGINVSVANTQNKLADIMNVGIGTSQVLPVLVTGLLSEEGEILVFEQPELHLHPYSQSRLADFFVELIKHGRTVIIETHSEAFILRLRYHVLMENCSKENIAINFFQNKDGTKVSLCNISGYGSISYPDDFKDETQELLNALMNAALKKEKE